MKNNLKKGVSFVEMLVYLSVLAIVLIVVVSFLIWMNKASFKTRAQREVFEDVLVALRKIGYELREAEAVYWPTTFSDQLSLASFHYLPSAETLTYLDFSICEQRICFKKESQEPIFITSPKTKVQYLRFDVLGVDSVRMSLSLEHVLADEFLSATSTFSLRNYE